MKAGYEGAGGNPLDETNTIDHLCENYSEPRNAKTRLFAREPIAGMTIASTKQNAKSTYLDPGHVGCWTHA